MALATSVSGDGRLVSSESREITYTVSNGLVYNKYKKVTTHVTHRWVALTETAATTWRDDTGNYAEGESRRISLDNAVIGSYSAESEIETSDLILLEHAQLEWPS